VQKLDDGSEKRAKEAAEKLGLNRKEAIQEEIADARRAREEMLRQANLSGGERLRIERATAERIKALNRELATATASAFKQRMQAAATSLRTMGTGLMTGSQTLAPASLAAGVAGVQAVRSVAGTEQAGFALRALLRTADEQQLLQIEKLIRDTAEDNRTFTVDEITQAAQILASQGVTAPQILDGALLSVISGAAGSGSGLEESARLITQAANIFGIAAKDMQTVADAGAGLLDISKFGVADLGFAMSQGGSVAAAAGLNFEEFSAIIGVMSKSFESGSDAGTSLKTFIQSLVNDTDAAQAAKTALGFDPFDEKGELRDPRDLIASLEKAKGNMSTEEFLLATTDLFGSDAARAATSLASGGVKAYDESLEGVRKGDAEASRAIREQGLNAQLKELGNSFKELLLAIADTGLLETITEFTKSLTELVRAASQSSPELLKWGAIITGIVAILAPLGMILGAVAVGFSFLAKGIMAVVAVGGTLLSWGGTLLGWAGKALGLITRLGGWLLRLGPIFGGLGGFLARAAAAIAAFVLGIPALPAILIVAGLTAALAFFKDEILAAVTWVVERAMAIWDRFWGALTNAKIGDTNLAEITKNAGKTAAASIVPGGGLAMGAWNALREVSGYANGVIGLRGPGTGTSDSIPARLSRGESVLTARATSFWGRDFLTGIQNLDPATVMRPVPVPVSSGGGAGGLHSVTISFPEGDVPGFYGKPDAIEQINRFQSSRKNSQYARMSRSAK
jgi:TP901 family phage tail tape measure protein